MSKLQYTAKEFHALDYDQQLRYYHNMMVKHCGYGIGQERCKYAEAPHCIGIGDYYDFRMGTRMCNNCYQFRRAERDKSMNFLKEQEQDQEPVKKKKQIKKKKAEAGTK